MEVKAAKGYKRVNEGHPEGGKVNEGHPEGGKGSETQMFSSEHCRQISIK